MSVLIKDMSMPSSCSGCPIKGDSYCRLTREKVKYHHVYRHDLCPLVELPPHGDLISRDDAIRILERIRDHCENDDMSFALNWAAQTIRDFTAIIPAEREGEA